MKVSTRISLTRHVSLLTPIDARRYFKQSEIILYRQAPDSAGAQQQIMASAPDNSSKIMPGAMQAV